MMNLHQKKLSMHAAETLYQGTVYFHLYKQRTGTRTVEETDYRWSVKDDEICVVYSIRQKEFVKCIEYD